MTEPTLLSLIRQVRAQRATKPDALDDERQRLEGSLAEESAWPFIDAASYQPNWAIDALCEHLAAVTEGKISRLLINFPPRAGKTTIASAIWPAWTWAQRERSFRAGPSVRFLCASYGHTLALSSSNLTRRLILSPWYQRLWGRRFEFREDMNTKAQFDLSTGGSRLSTSVGGSLLGIGGDIIICFPYGEIVHTETGPRAIGEIVETRAAVRVWSFDSKTGRRGLKPITGWRRNPGSALVRVTLSDGSSFRCTPGHQIWTRRGWVAAADLALDDVLPSFTKDDIADCLPVHTAFSGERPLAQTRPPDMPHGGCGEFRLRVRLATRMVVAFAKAFGDIGPSHAASDLLDRAALYAVSFGKGVGSVAACCDGNGLSLSQDSAGAPLIQWKRPVSLGVGDIFAARAVAKIIKAGISSVAVFVSGLLTCGTRTDESCQYQSVAEAAVRFPGRSEINARVSPMRAGFQDLLSLPIRRSTPRNSSRFATDAAEARNTVVVEPGDRTPVLVENVGYAHVTYCLTVADFHTFVAGSGAVVVRNCDDPHNVAQAESEVERETVLNWWSELSTTRLNDPKQSAIVVIMQRLHEADVSGTILSGDEDWCHLMIPMEYDWRRHCSTSLGWNDPRGLDDDGIPLVENGLPRDAEAAVELDGRNGALMWPERFGAKEVEAIKAGLGPYMASGRLQQSPQPKGGGIFKSEWWQVWEGTHFPVIDLVIASLDSAFTEKQENDPSALTVWGVFKHPGTGRTRIILIDAWRKHLQMHGSATPRLEHEILRLGDDAKVRRYRDTLLADRVGKTWGLVEWTVHTMRKWSANILLIEGKASGLTVHQELRRLHSDENWSIQLLQPKGDKVTRALAAQPTFAQGLVYAPVRDWSQMVIDEMELFPKGRYDDLTDSTTMAVSFLRSSGILQTDAEAMAAEENTVMHRPRRLRALYPC